MELEFIDKIKDFPDYYVSDYGRVFSEKRGKFKELKRSDNGTGYLRILLHKNGKIYHKLVHRLVCETFLERDEGKEICDHINRIRTDNRLSNLRWVNNSENSRNREIQKNNMTGVTGVSWNKYTERWIASISTEVNKEKQKTFKTKDEAIKWRLEMEEKYYKLN